MTRLMIPFRFPLTGAITLRIVLLLVCVVAATWATHLLRQSLSLTSMPVTPEQIFQMKVMGLISYVVLMAIPFVPGAEIGVALLTAFGAAVAPLVYGATVLALVLAYGLGRLLPVAVLARVLWFLRLRRAAAMITRAAPLSRSQRVDMLLQGAPPGLVALALRHRYIALALAVNLPGNVVIGGGGGIMMMAGLSRIFAPLPTIIAIAIGVSPVPLAVALFGM